MSLVLRILWLVSVLVFAVVDESAGLASTKKGEALQVLSADAFVWGYPSVLMREVRESMLNQTANPQKSMNHFFHGTGVPETFFKNFIPVNSENLYSWAWVDLNQEPLVFTQPAMAHRYFSVQFVDAFTNVFQVISNETLGDKASVYALTSPSWKGDLPPGVVRIRATTPQVFILAQSNLKSAEELPSVLKLTHQWQLIPLSSWKNGLRRELAVWKTPLQSFPVKTDLATFGSDFLSKLFEVTAMNPPPTSADAKRLQFFSKRLLSLNPDEKVAVERGLFAGARQIEDRVAKGFGSKVNGWSYQMRAEPFREDYLTRAAVAETSFFSSPPQELVHLKAVADSEDRQLYSNYKYVLHFNKGELPPTPTSWTLSVYQQASKKLANVPLEKARLTESTPGLKFNADGSMDIRLQQEMPEKSEQANWLRLQDESSFFVVLTLYNPRNSVLNRKYVAPAIARVDEESLPRPRIVRTMMAESSVSKRDIRHSPARARMVTSHQQFDR